MITPPPVGAVWGERFELREQREGGPGRVTYLARDRAFGTDVELWWILPGIHRDEAADALVEGAATLRSLVHPAVRALVDTGFAEGTTWAAYALAAPGVRPREKAPMPTPAVAAWARAVAAGLGAAHQVGWFHGRLVPADVVLVQGGVRVGGLALWMMAEPVSVAAWQAQAAYLAPEVIAGWTVGPAADVWGLAAAVAALATGDERAIEEPGLLEARLPRLAAALAGALVPDPTARIELAELVRRIDAVAAGGPEPLGPMPSRTAAPPVPSRPAPPEPSRLALPLAPPPTTRPPDAAVEPLAPLHLPPEHLAPPQAHHHQPAPPPPAPLQAVSLRPGGQRPPTAPMAAVPPPGGDGQQTYVPLSELSPVTVAPGAIGYVAPPRELTPPPRRRWVPIVGIVLGAMTAAGIALVVATQTGTDEPSDGQGAVADDPGTAEASGPTTATAPRLPLSPAEPARGCTDLTLALGDVCVEPFEAPGKGHVPTTGLTARAAADACAARDLRLCTPSEWRAACAGTERVAVLAGACNLGAVAIAAAGTFERCVSAIDAHDLAGNVAEWVADGTALGASALDGGDGRCDGPPRKAPAGATFLDVGYRCCGDR